MTIEIHNPELLDTFRGANSDASEDEKKSRALAAADRIRELRQHSKPDPEGLTSLDYIRLGRR